MPLDRLQRSEATNTYAENEMKPCRSPLLLLAGLVGCLVGACDDMAGFEPCDPFQVNFPVGVNPAESPFAHSCFLGAAVLYDTGDGQVLLEEGTRFGDVCERQIDANLACQNLCFDTIGDANCTFAEGNHVALDGFDFDDDVDEGTCIFAQTCDPEMAPPTCQLPNCMPIDPDPDPDPTFFCGGDETDELNMTLDWDGMPPNEFGGPGFYVRYRWETGAAEIPSNDSCGYPVMPAAGVSIDDACKDLCRFLIEIEPSPPDEEILQDNCDTFIQRSVCN
ncbi:MAG: hypothetical protein AAGE52_12930 [Myxococcota bacterium]